MANNGLSGHVTTTSALPLTADIRAPMSASDRGPEANFCWKYAESIMVRGHFGGLFLRGVAPAGHCNGSRDGGGAWLPGTW